MSQTQKIIKYLAFAFALFLIVSIVSGVMYGFVFLGNVFYPIEENVALSNPVSINENTLCLDIDVSSSNITIKVGDALSFQTNNQYIYSEEENNQFSIKEKKHNWFSKNQELVIYIPKDVLFEEVEMKTGAGKIMIEQLSTKKLSLDLGAGNISIKNLNVLERTKIESGAGKLDIASGIIHNLDFDMGVGSVSISSQFVGDSKINSGIGKLYLCLFGTLEDYEVTLDKGLGNATIQKEEMKNGSIYGTGTNRLEIDGGIGNIEIQLIEK